LAHSGLGDYSFDVAFSNPHPSGAEDCALESPQYAARSLGARSDGFFKVRLDRNPRFTSNQSKAENPVQD
jgi:hypothetical protein